MRIIRVEINMRISASVLRMLIANDFFSNTLTVPLLSEHRWVTCHPYLLGNFVPTTQI